MTMSNETRRRFDQEQAAYSQQRNELLALYPGKWVAIVGGRVAAVADQMNKAAAEAFRQTGSTIMYVACVGKEDAVLRLRQIAAGYYDSEYVPPIPMVKTAVGNLHASEQDDVAFVIDTGADLTLLRADIADGLNLWENVAGRVRVAGVGGSPEWRELYNAVVYLAERSVLVMVDCRSDFDENVLGRDFINEFELTVCAKRNEVKLAWIDDQIVDS